MRRWSVVTCVMIVVGLAACGSDEPVFTARQTTFDVDPGDAFSIVLESNASTGYSWALETPLDERVVRLVGSTYLDSGSGRVGAPGGEELTFQAVDDGSTFIQLWYVRSFDDPPEPADRAQFEVTVGSGDPGDPVDPSDTDEPASTVPDDEDAISVSDLLADAPQAPTAVTGLLFDDGSGLRLCESLAESFPPQCPGPDVSITNPDAVVADFTVEGGVRWTDRPVVLYGRYAEEGFTAQS